jgi:hypothetical protein
MHLRDANQVIQFQKKYFFIQNNLIESLHERVNYCNDAVKTDTLPNLDVALNDYEFNIRKMIAFAKHSDLHLVFVNQPTLWHEGMDKKSLNYCYSNLSLNQPTVYSLSAYLKGINTFNHRLESICKTENISFIDLDGNLPKDTNTFFDFCHFNNSGTEKVSQVLSDNLVPLIIKDNETVQN